jgi:hypothetical protein
MDGVDDGTKQVHMEERKAKLEEALDVSALASY